MFTWLEAQINSGKSLLFDGASLAAVVLLIQTYIKTKALIPVVVAGVTAGVVLFAVHNTSWFQTKVQQQSGTGALVASRPASNRAGQLLVMTRSGRVAAAVWTVPASI